ncbi:MAG TPA: glucose-1-phosphate adenylyltransferase family protein [Syntrophorhabdaceae bacterium]|jgi:glucose-1-phosphate adenylyltransferase
MKDVLALILAGGRVDDLGVLTFFRPKSVMPFGGLYRVIDFAMSNLSRSGIEKVGILSQYRHLHLMQHIANGMPWDMVGRNRFATVLPPFQGPHESKWYRGTADAVYQNLHFIEQNKTELVIILSGDHVYSMDYGKLIDFHLETKADLTMAFTKIPEHGANRFGIGHIRDEDPRGGRVLHYVEKPEKPPYEWASLTIFVIEPRLLVKVLEANALRESHEFGKDIIPELVKGKKVYGYKHEGYWGYTRTFREYWDTSMELVRPHPKIDLKSWQIITNLEHSNIRDGQPALVGREASIHNSLFYSGCHIGGTVRNSILFPGSRVADGAIVEDSILFFGATVERDAQVRGVIADTGAVIGKGTEIGGNPPEELTIIGREASIPAKLKISHGVTVYPGVVQKHFHKVKYGPGEIIT